MIDQLTGKHDKAGQTQLIPFVKKLCQLTRKRSGRLILKPVVRYKFDPRLRGIGNNKPEIRIFCQLHIIILLCIRINAAGNNTDAGMLIHYLAILHTPQEQIIVAVLLHQHIAHSLFNRLYDNHRTVKQALIRQFLEKIIYKSS